jgi:hypothetical protein
MAHLFSEAKRGATCRKRRRKVVGARLRRAYV